MRVLITGGNGFIGSHLVDQTLRAGWDVSVYDKDEERFRPRQEHVQYLRGNLYTDGVPQEALRDLDVLYHLACSTIHKTSNEDPVFDIQSNLVSTVKLLQQCVEARVKRFVFLSSGGTVYGIPEDLPVSEAHVTNPICSYGIHKLAIEKYLDMFCRLYGLDYVVLRPSNPYGERQDYGQEQGAVTVFLGKIALGEPITIWGDGGTVRDYFHVEDLARACISAATKKVDQRILNVSSGVGLSLNQLVSRIEAVLGLEAHVERNSIGARPFDVPTLYLDSSEAERVLSWRPEVSLDDGIIRTWLWVQSIVGEDGKRSP